MWMNEDNNETRHAGMKYNNWPQHDHLIMALLLGQRRGEYGESSRKSGTEWTRLTRSASSMTTLSSVGIELHRSPSHQNLIPPRRSHFMEALLEHWC